MPHGRWHFGNFSDWHLAKIFPHRHMIKYEKMKRCWDTVPTCIYIYPIRFILHLPCCFLWIRWYSEAVLIPCWRDASHHTQWDSWAAQSWMDLFESNFMRFFIAQRHLVMNRMLGNQLFLVGKSWQINYQWPFPAATLVHQGGTQGFLDHTSMFMIVYAACDLFNPINLNLKLPQFTWITLK